MSIVFRTACRLVVLTAAFHLLTSYCARAQNPSPITVQTTYRKHASAISSIAFSPDDTLVATSAADGSVHVWTTKGGDPLWLLPAGSSTGRSVAISPDGRYVAATTGRVPQSSVTFWSLVNAVARYRLPIAETQKAHV